MTQYFNNKINAAINAEAEKVKEKYEIIKTITDENDNVFCYKLKNNLTLRKEHYENIQKDLEIMFSNELISQGIIVDNIKYFIKIKNNNLWETFNNNDFEIFSEVPI